MLSLALFLACAPADETTDKADDTTTANADADGDGLTADEETELGTSDDAADFDGDGFEDGDEVAAGTNPAWTWSHAYAQGDYLIGSCPVLPSTETGPTGRGAGGDAYQPDDIMHNFGEGGADAFGQEMPLYAFCGNYVLVTLSAEWCGPCQQFAQAMPAEMEAIRAEVPNFTFYEVLFQNNRGGNPNQRTLENWRDSFGLDGIPVVAPADNTAAEVAWINASGYIPSTVLVAPDMTVLAIDPSDPLRVIKRHMNAR